MLKKIVMKNFLPYFKLLGPVRFQFILAIFFGLVAGAASGAGLPLLVSEVFPLIFRSEKTGLTADAPGWLLSFVEFLGVAVPSSNQIVLFACLSLPVIFVVRGVAGYLNTYFINYSGLYVLEELRLMTFDKLQRLPLAFHKKHKEGDVLSRVMGDTSAIQGALVKVASDFIIQPVTLISAVTAVVLLALKHDGVTIILGAMLTIPLSVFPIRLLGKNLLKKARVMQEKGGDMTATVSENLASQQEVRAYSMEDAQVEKLRVDSTELRSLQMKTIKYQYLISPSVEILSTFGICLAIYLGAQKGLTLEVFAPIIMAMYFAYEPVKKLGGLSASLRQAEASLERVEHVLKADDDMPEPTNPKLLENVQGHVGFSNVEFAYAEEPILTQINLDVTPGEVVALVGPSGAGKSTFVSLVPRFYEVNSGSLTIDGIDVRDISKRNLRDNIALVSQQPLLFRGSIAENIRIGRPSASDVEVEAAARHANAHDFISEQELGYNTAVGERGEGLSGGQRQRVAIARAFLKDAPILILDEATSALDTESESQIQAALKKLSKGRTTFLIAHRFSSIRDAGRILVFDKTAQGGQIIADGTHAELYESCALYKDLYDKQGA